MSKSEMRRLIEQVPELKALAAEIERLKADCAAMREACERKNKALNGAFAFLSGHLGHRDPILLAVREESLDVKPNPGSDLLAELHALREVADAAIDFSFSVTDRQGSGFSPWIHYASVDALNESLERLNKLKAKQ